MRRALAAAVAGILLVPGVLLADDAVPAVPAPATPTAPAAVPAPPPPQPQPQAQEQSKPPPSKPAPVVAAAAKKKAPSRKKEPKAHAAGAGGVTIQNFAFAPGTISIRAGDTVTWTNRDSAPHTATGSGGSFNTGTLKRGQSGSHTFSKAGRFAYICAIHPNMHGTVVVAAATAATPSSSPGSSASAAPASSPKGPTLPNTGLQLAIVALTGAVLTASGMALRRLGQRADRGV